MPDRPHHSKKMHDCVDQVMAKGHDEQSAYAICTAALQGAGEDIYASDAQSRQAFVWTGEGAIGKPFKLRAFDPNVGGGTDRDKLPESDFAGKNRSFPIKKPGDVSDAAASIGRAGSDNYDSATLKKNIIRIAKRKGPAFVAQLPKAWRDEQ